MESPPTFNKYLNGKIYLLMNDLTHQIFYIGSTSETLKHRLSKHIASSFSDSQHDYNCKKSKSEW